MAARVSDVVSLVGEAAAAFTWLRTLAADAEGSTPEDLAAVTVVAAPFTSVAQSR